MVEIWKRVALREISSIDPTGVRVVPGCVRHERVASSPPPV